MISLKTNDNVDDAVIFFSCLYSFTIINLIVSDSFFFFFIVEFYTIYFLFLLKQIIMHKKLKLIQIQIV